MGENPFSFPPKVPKGVRTAERKTTPEEFDLSCTLRLLPAVNTKLPDRIELRPAPRAMLRCQILSAVRAVSHWPALRQSPPAKLASLSHLHRRAARYCERSRRLTGAASIAVSSLSCNRVAAGILGRDRDAEFLKRVGR